MHLATSRAIHLPGILVNMLKKERKRAMEASNARSMSMNRAFETQKTYVKEAYRADDDDDGVGSPQKSRVKGLFVVAAFFSANEFSDRQAFVKFKQKRIQTKKNSNKKEFKQKECK